MLLKIFRTRLGLDWTTQRIKFIDVISEPIMDSIRLEQDRKIPHRAHFDIWIEYESSWWRVGPVIHSIGYEINDKISGVFYEPESYGMSILLVNR